jgi:selenocysteine-specific elongation factor
LREAGDAGLQVASLPVRLGVSPHEAGALLAGEGVLTVGERVVASEVAADLEERLVRLVDDAHHAHPLEVGISLQELRSRLGAPPELTDLVLAHAVAAQRLESTGGVVRAAGWTPRLTPSQQKKLTEIEETLRAANSEPPSVAELEPRFGAEVADLLRLLERQGRLVAVEPERFYSAESVATLIERLRAGMTKGREYSPAELRDLLGFSRKFLIPFLEYCDRRGLTVRSVTGRVWHGT